MPLHDIADTPSIEATSAVIADLLVWLSGPVEHAGNMLGAERSMR